MTYTVRTKIEAHGKTTRERFDRVAEGDIANIRQAARVTAPTGSVVEVKVTPTPAGR
jgi:hypothetical protein